MRRDWHWHSGMLVFEGLRLRLRTVWKFVVQAWSVPTLDVGKAYAFPASRASTGRVLGLIEYGAT